MILSLALAGCDSAGTKGSVGETSRAPSNLNLPTIPWEGGSRYWEKFPAAVAGGWTDPNFFPIIAWFNGISTDEEVEYDKSVGINTYVGGSSQTPYRLFGDNGVYWIGEKLKDSPPDAKNWVGYFLDDEVDGRFTPFEKGRAHLEQLRKSQPEGRFGYTNYTALVLTTDMKEAEATTYVNQFSDVVSTDMYWYTTPFCHYEPFRAAFLVPIHKKTCQSSSSYGREVAMLRQRDAEDDKLQPLWQFVEIVGGGPADGPFVALISPDQLRGAVMSSLIHEARGIAYFNQALFGPCMSGNIIRQSQLDSKFCGRSQVQGMAVINGQIRQLARVLNSQSYEFEFGPGLDTMLKLSDGYAYVFAMIDDSGAPGKRTFELPSGIRGTEAEVLFEDRRVPVTGRRFEDSFASESTYHVYRVRLSTEG